MAGWYASRAVGWLPLLACTALGALFAAVQLLRSDGGEPSAYALLGLVPAAAFAVDEPAAAVVDSGAASLRWRTAARAWSLSVPAGVFLGLVAWAAGRPGTPTALLLAAGWVLMGLAFAATVVLRRAGQESPSLLVAPAAVLALTADLTLGSRLPAALRPLNLETDAPWLRLGALAVVAAGLAVWGSRDLLDPAVHPGVRRVPVVSVGPG